jgi:hypothetical protein
MTDAMTAIVLIGGILALFITITWILFPFILIGKLNECESLAPHQVIE